MKDEDYLKKWLDGSLSDQELEEFKKTDEYQFVQRMDDLLVNFKAPEYQLVDIVEKTKKGQPQAKQVSFYQQEWFKVAASIALVLGLMIYLLSPGQPEMVETLADRKTQIYLPDSSRVMLNAGSKIAYNPDTWIDNRKVNLDGEAYFSVKKGSTFSVLSPRGKVTVLGTIFNVEDRTDLFEVKCFEGQVRVSHNEDQAVISASESISAIDAKLSEIKQLKENAPDWMLGESRFERASLKHVLDEFARQYQIEIITNDVNTTRTFSGRFVHNDIDLALKSITLPLNISFKVEGNKVWLSNNQ